MKKTLLFLFAVLVLNVSFAYVAFSHISNIARSPEWTQSNYTYNLTINVTNNGSDSIVVIIISDKVDRLDPYLILDAFCPSGWNPPQFSDTDGDGKNDSVTCTNGVAPPLTPGNSVSIVLNLTSPNLTDNTTSCYNWTLTTWDNATVSNESRFYSSNFVTFVDNQEPISNIVYPNKTYISCNSTLKIIGTASDYNGSGVSKVWISSDNGITWNLTNGTNMWNFTFNCSDGYYSLVTRAEDNVGLVESNFSVLNFTIDTTNPNLTINYPVNGWYALNITLNVTADDNNGIDAVYFKWENTTNSSGWVQMNLTNSSWTYDFDTTVLEDGNYTLIFNATDVAGNSKVSSVNVSLDNLGPQLIGLWLSDSDLHRGDNVTEILVNISGKTNISLTKIKIITPNGYDIINLSFISGNLTNGIWGTNYTAERYGTYEIIEINASNILGVENSFNSTEQFTLKGVCGNGVCEPDESRTSCKKDCKKKSSGGGGGGIIFSTIPPKVNETTVTNETNETNLVLVYDESTNLSIENEAEEVVNISVEESDVVEQGMGRLTGMFFDREMLPQNGTTLFFLTISILLLVVYLLLHRGPRKKVFIIRK